MAERSIADYMDELSAVVTGEKKVSEVELMTDEQFADVLARLSEINRESRVSAAELAE